MKYNRNDTWAVFPSVPNHNPVKLGSGIGTDVKACEATPKETPDHPKTPADWLVAVPAECMTASREWAYQRLVFDVVLAVEIH